MLQLIEKPITIAMTTPMIAITVYWRFRYAAAPSWIAAAISRIRSLPVGLARTRNIRTTAKATAASPPATPNHAVLGSIYLLVSRKRRKMPAGRAQGALLTGSIG